MSTQPPPREQFRIAGIALKRWYENRSKKTSVDDNFTETAHIQRPEITQVPAEYQHTPLANPRHIRLLELYPGESGDLIICRLFEAGLDSCVDPYEALSYVWGISDNLVRIQANGLSLEIGPNLHCALLNLRYVYRSRILWVDAVCIDQSNIPERNIQLPLMHEIYSGAACTICFLGPETEKTRAAYAMVEELAQEGKKLRIDAPAYDTTKTVPTLINHFPTESVQSPLREKYLGDTTIRHLAMCEWWHRSWTLQELLLSSNAIMMRGRYTANWDDVNVAIDHGFNLNIWSSSGSTIDESAVPYVSIRALMNRRRYRQQADSPALDFFYLLVHCKYRLSKDPKDKVYAVLGLLCDMHNNAINSGHPESLNIKLDYDQSVVDLYSQVSQELIQKTGSLDTLGFCHRSSHDNNNLPSWVVDWSVTTLSVSPLMQDSLDRPRTTHAGARTTVSARFPSDGRTLIISGHELTAVSALAETYGATSSNHDIQLYPKPANISELLTRIKGAVETIHNSCNDAISSLRILIAWEEFATTRQLLPPQDGNSNLDVYWQTLCTGTYKSDSIEETSAMFKKWSEHLELLRQKPSYIKKKLPEIDVFRLTKRAWNVSDPFQAYIMSKQNRCLGFTNNGWLCLLPHETKVGDSIILAKGGRVPLVLRSNEDGYNRLIGEAYIHGIMNGEAFEESKCTDIKIR